VDPLVVRAALVVLTFTAGIGLVLYAVGAALSEPEGASSRAWPEPDARRNLAVALIALGVALVVRSTGLWLGDAVMVPLIVVVAGVVVLGVVRTSSTPGSTAGSSPGSTAGLAAGGQPTTQLAEVMTGRHARARVLLGAVLVAAGLVIVGVGDRVPWAVRAGVFATALTVVGVAVVVGPWIAGLAQAAAEERRQRIRSQEREAMAAHLHDSVLQTLALIQRNADDPRRTVTLARQQEHELRAWLYGVDAQSAGTFAGAVREVARDVEQRYDVQIDVVVVGDAPMRSPASSPVANGGDEAEGVLAALVAALREACVNAAKHSGEDRFAVYAEVGDDVVELFVRDRGVGFDRARAAADRRGIAQSIEARLERVGGTSTIESGGGAGTEVHLAVPFSRSASEVGS
jgi:signal transduction histidine kinase